LKIIASGSSALEITKGSHDLSRRAIIFQMYGMSFREFIGMNNGIYFDSIPLDTLLANHQEISDSIVQSLKKTARRY
jgi:predicted AAA+ superfamily ATPase